MPEIPLQVITSADVRASIKRARRSLELAAAEIVWQIEMEAWRTLGYSSWTAMREAEYGGAAFMVPSKADRERLAGLTPGDLTARIKHMREAESAARTERLRLEAYLSGDLRSCSVCGAEVVGRADAKFCSTACRVKSHRG